MDTWPPVTQQLVYTSCKLLPGKDEPCPQATRLISELSINDLRFLCAGQNAQVTHFPLWISPDNCLHEWKGGWKGGVVKSKEDSTKREEWKRELGRMCGDIWRVFLLRLKHLWSNFKLN